MTLSDANKSHAPQQAASRLRNALRMAWVERGSVQLSARDVAKRAGVQPSQINYYFGTFEQLLSCVQADAIQEARLWCEGQLTQFGNPGGTTLTPQAFGYLLSTLIDAWCETARDLSFLMGECHLAASRSHAFADPLYHWHQTWTDFWAEICARTGYMDQLIPVRQFFFGESFLHRIRWRHTLDRAVLTETCVDFTHWLCDVPIGTGELRRNARHLSRLSPNDASGPVQRQLVSAAADIVGMQGAENVTHRAVALASGLKTGAVTYHFPTSQDLLQGAWAEIYRRLVSSEKASAEVRVGLVDGLHGFVTDSRIQPSILAMEELLSQSARQPDLTDLGASIRYSRGETTEASLMELGLAPDARRQLAAIVSTCLQGMRRDILSLTAKPERMQSELALSSEFFRHRIGGKSGRLVLYDPDRPPAL